MSTSSDMLRRVIREWHGLDVPWWTILARGFAFLDAEAYGNRGPSVSRKSCLVLCELVTELNARKHP